MEYSISAVAKVKSILISRIQTEILLAQKNNTLDEFISKYNINLNEPPVPVDTRKMKVLVIGDLAGKKKDFLLAAKKCDVSENNIEFIGFEDVDRINPARLKYSHEYSDIICGPVPHKVKGMGDASSLYSLLESQPDIYPKVIRAISNESLKITISNFKSILLQTKYFETLSERNI